MNAKYALKSVFLSLLIGLQLSSSAYAADVIINGQLLTHAQQTTLENRIGTRIVPGNYISDGDCWTNLSNGTSGCLSTGTINNFSRSAVRTFYRW